MLHSSENPINVVEESNGSSGYKRRDPPAWLTRQLLQRCLDASRNYQFIISDIVVGYGCSPSQTFASSLFRAYLTLRDNNKSTSVIIKCIPDDVGSDIAVAIIRGFKKETIILSKIMIEVKSLLESIGSLDSIAAEWIWGGEVPTHFLVMEDLSVSSYDMAKRTKGLDLQHSMLVMKLIGKYHAATAIILQRDGAVVEDFKVCSRFESGNDRGLRNYIKIVSSIVLSSLAEISDFRPGLLEKANKIFKSIPDDLEKLSTYKPERFNVLVHGDLWVNNLMFKYLKGEVVSVKFIDFQESYISSPVNDVLFYLFSSVTEEVELNNCDLLINEYYKTLSETLNMLNYNGIPYTYQDFMNDMKQCALLAVFSTFFVFPLALASEDSSVPFEGTSRGHMDYFENVFSNPHSIYRLQRILSTFDEMGVL